MIKVQVVSEITAKFIKKIYIFAEFKIFDNPQKQKIKLLRECYIKYYRYNKNTDCASYYTEHYWGRVSNKYKFYIK